MIILGIDPGTAIVGYGVIESEGSRISLVDYGVITTKAHTPLPERLLRVHQGIEELIRLFHPDCMAVESLFFNKNTRTALAVGQARGVILLAAEESKLPVAEYTPLQVKQAIVGYGRAEKQQVQYMVQTFLHMRELPKPDDAADALAIAICHSHSMLGRRLAGEEV